MIYKYTVENGILEQRSLFQIPFKSANGYTVRIDDKILVNGLDYSIDGSRLWIERDIAGSVFSISDNVEDETEVLLNKIGQVETALSTLKAGVDNNKTQLASLLESLEELEQLQTEKDDTYTELFEALKTEIDGNTSSIETLSDNTSKELETYIDLVSDVEKELREYIQAVLNTATSNHSAIRKEIAVINDRLVNNEIISALNQKYEELSSVITELKKQISNIPVGVDTAQLESIEQDIASLRSSIGMETAQRRLIDKEIKLLLEQLFNDVTSNIEANAVFQERVLQILDYYKKDYDSKITALDKRVSLLEDIIVLGDDVDKSELMFNEYKKEMTERLSDISRITVANSTRLEKLRHKTLGFDLKLENKTGVLGKLLEERLKELKNGGVL